MTTLTATAANVAAQFAACKPGDTLILSGEIVGWRPARRSFSPPLTVDCSRAVLSDFYGGALVGVRFVGATVRYGPTFKVGFRLDKSSQVSISDFTLVGDQFLGIGIMFLDAQNIHIERVKGTGFQNGIALSRVQSFSVYGVELLDLDGDGVDLYNVADGTVEDIAVIGRTPITAIHPDGVQLASEATGFETSNVAIRRVRVRGDRQGVTAFNHPDSGQLGFSNIVIEDCDVEVSYPQGIALYDCAGGAVRNNRVRTAPGAQWQAIINILGACSGVTRSGNVVSAALGRPAVVD